MPLRCDVNAGDRNVPKMMEAHAAIVRELSSWILGCSAP
jgi:hypothetical protein